MFPSYAQKVRNGIVFCLFALILFFSLLRYGNLTYITYSLILGLPFFIIYFLLTDEVKPKIKTKLKDLLVNPLFVFFAFVSLSGISVFYSVSRYDSLLSFLSLVALGLILIAANVFFNNQKRVEIFAPIFLIFSLFLSLSGLSFYLFTDANKTNLPLLGGNFFTGFLLISLPIAFWGLFKNEGIKKDLLYGIPFTILLSILFLEKEMEFWIILGFILVFLLFLVFRSKKFNIRKIISKTILVSVVAYLLFYGLGVIKDKKIVLDRLQLVSETTLRLNLDLYNKKNHWQSTLEIIKKHPFGTGLGTFSLIYPVYKKDVLSFDKNSHSYFLQILSEVGVLGFIVFFWFGIILIWRGFKLINLKDKNNFWAPTFLISIIGIFTYNIVSSDFSNLSNFSVFLVFSGIILSSYNNSLPPKYRESIYTIKNRIVFLLLSFLLLVFGAWQLFTNTNFNLGRDIEDYNFKEAKGRYEKSVKLNSNPYFLAKLAELNYYLRGHEDNLEQAYRLTEKSINLTSYNSLAYIVLGNLNLNSLDTERAIDSFKKVVELDPLGEINGYIYLSDTYFKKGDYKKVEEILSFILPKYPKEVIEKRLLLSKNSEAFNLTNKIVKLHNLLGISFLYENSPLLAEESLKKALELSPEDSDSRYYLGIALEKQGKVLEGEQEKAKVLEDVKDYKPPYEIK